MTHEAAVSASVEGALLWEPSEAVKARANLTHYLRWLERTRGLTFASYEEAWRWSVEQLEAFWASIWEYFGVRAHRPYEQVLGERRMPGARWFPGAELNYAEHALRRADDHPALVFRNEAGVRRELTYAELRRQVAAARAGLERLGVRRGDRVVAYLPNIPETTVAFLAAASLGAIWSSCAPEFGTRSVVDRFQQIEPKVLLAVDGYQYNGRPFDRRGVVAEIQAQLPTLATTVIVPYLEPNRALDGLSNVRPWSELVAEPGELAFDPVPFEHPLWVLYSSGTTGLPKPIVHGHGGILLEQYKTLAFSKDIHPEDRFFWFTSTGWMMWNFLVGGLLQGATIVLYDGSPGYPDLNALWRLAEETGITYFGTSAPYLLSCLKAGIEPGRDFDLSRIVGIGSTGAPLPPEGFAWVYEHVKRDVLLGSTSGGTDVCTAFVGPCPLLPVRSGELQCRGLGAKVEAFDEQGRSVIGQVGELVITAPMPSMPLFFWNDPDGRRYRESYFEHYPGVWRHGDWIKINPSGSCVIYGRSDATLNRGGVRMGTSEFYRAVDLPEVLDSLVVDTSQLGPDGRLIEGRLVLFVVLRPGVELTEELKRRISEKVRRELSPRHVPDEIYAAPDIPKTLNGKKCEVPVKRVLLGAPPERAISRDALSNPESFAFYVELAKRRA